MCDRLVGFLSVTLSAVVEICDTLRGVKCFVATGPKWSAKGTWRKVQTFRWLLQYCTSLQVRSWSRVHCHELHICYHRRRFVHGVIHIMLLFTVYLGSIMFILHSASTVLVGWQEGHLACHCKALNSLICADVPLRNYSLTHSGL